MPTTRHDETRSPGARWWTLLLIIPFIALLYVPFYNRLEPMIGGVPFFYWYQFLWVILTSGLIIFVQSRIERPEPRPTKRVVDGEGEAP